MDAKRWGWRGEGRIDAVRCGTGEAKDEWTRSGGAGEAKDELTRCGVGQEKRRTNEREAVMSP